MHHRRNSRIGSLGALTALLLGLALGMATSPVLVASIRIRQPCLLGLACATRT